MRYKKNKIKGFSLIEVLVVVGLMILIFSLGFSSFQEQRRQVKYNESIAHVLSMIKTAQNHALTSKPVFDENKNPGEQNSVPKEGYGVYIERSETPGSSTVILFANTVAEKDEEANQYDEGDIIEERYSLDSNVDFIGLSIDQLQPNPTPISQNESDKAVIIFKPPLADATLAVNDHPQKDQLSKLDDLYLEFKRIGTDAPSQYIHINAISGIAEISHAS